MAVQNLKQSKAFEQLVDNSVRGYLQWDKIAIRDMLLPGEVISEAIAQNVSHVCQASHPYFIQDLNVAALMLGRPEIFIQNPIASILSTTTVQQQATSDKHKILEFVFDRAEQKMSLMQRVEVALSAMTVSASVMSDALIIADELFTNAVYNAPFVDLDNTRHGASRDDQSTKMHEGKFGIFFMGSDTNRVVLGCRDMYGSLNLQKLFARIHKCYDTGIAESMNMSGGGAGIGSFMVYNAASSYFVVIEEAVSTMICGVLPLKMGSSRRQELPKNLHYIL